MGPELVKAWNEIVLDVELIHKELKTQPALVIPAIVYVKRQEDTEDGRQWNTASRKQAETMAAKLRGDYDMPQAVPVVAVHDWLDVTSQGFAGPFAFDGSVEEAVMV